MVGDIEVVKSEEIRRLENKKMHCKSSCRYFNRGCCKEGQSCDFLHPDQICQEYSHSGVCSLGKDSKERHPKSANTGQEESAGEAKDVFIFIGLRILPKLLMKGKV